MNQSHFAFEYSWADLKPIRAVVALVLFFQIVGALAGLFTRPVPGWFESVWYGGAFATFPGFLVGLFIQWRERPGSISANARMVWHVGFVAFVLSVSAVLMRRFGFFA